MTHPLKATASAQFANIYIAGDESVARQTCREFCASGACVTVTPTTYVYTGGAESGVIVGFIDYARFPGQPLLPKAEALAQLLADRLFQSSYSIVTESESRWYSARPSDNT